MALPTSYETVAPASGSPGRSGRVARVVSAAALVMFACAALVALLGSATEQKHASLLAVTPDQSLDVLALQFLKHGATMSVKDMEHKLNAWHNSPATLLDMPKDVGAGRTQMLALGPRASGESFGQALDGAGASLLCQKKDLIIDKFDELLKKLGGEELSANITMNKVSAEWKEAMTSWLDSESTYRLTVEKSKEATEGATFARNEYEKWADANKQAKKDLAATLTRHAAEREALASERQLIKVIMRLIGVLHDVKASDKSIAAGGRDSVKDSETGVSDPYAEQMTKTKAELHAKFAKLQSLALRTKVPGSTQKLAMINQHLAVYSETEEVAKILKEMLDDLEQRLKIIDTVDEQAKKLVDDTEAKMVEWEKQLVALSNAADKAKEKQASAQLEREKLNGKKKVSHANYDEEKDAYTLMIPPYEREIYVITMIKIKIAQHCEEQASGGAAAR